MIKRTMVMEPT